MLNSFSKGNNYVSACLWTWDWKSTSLWVSSLPACPTELNLKDTISIWIKYFKLNFRLFINFWALYFSRVRNTYVSLSEFRWLSRHPTVSSVGKALSDVFCLFHSLDYILLEWNNAEEEQCQEAGMVPCSRKFCGCFRKWTELGSASVIRLCERGGEKMEK